MSDYDRANRLHVEEQCNYLLRHFTGRAGAVEGGIRSVKSRAFMSLIVAAFLKRFSGLHISGKTEYDIIYHSIYSTFFFL